MSMMSMNDAEDVERVLSSHSDSGMYTVICYRVSPLTLRPESDLNDDEKEHLAKFERQAYKSRQNHAAYRALGANESDSED